LLKALAAQGFRNKEEIDALRELIQLQKNRVITIKPCDKGAGMIILDFPEYMRACYEHLLSEKVMEDGVSKKYYSRVEEIELERTKLKIRNLLDEGLENDILA
jgi:non-homologous end joining protein Ku